MSVRLYFDYRDLWTGVFWKVERRGFPVSPVRSREVTVYVCPLPCLVLRLRWLSAYFVDDSGTERPL